MLRRYDSDELLGGYAKHGGAHPDGLTGKQYALLRRFGLTGVAATNAPVIADIARRRAVAAPAAGWGTWRRPAADPKQLRGREAENSDRAVQLARAIAGGTFGTARRRPRPAAADWRTQPAAADKKSYDRALAAARARGNAAGAAALREAYTARRRQDAAAETARRQRRAKIRRDARRGPRSFNPAALTDDLGRATQGDRAARRRLVRQLVAKLWEAAEIVSATTARVALEKVLQDLLVAKGGAYLGSYVAAKQKYQTAAAARAGDAAKLAAGFVLKGACSLAGLPPMALVLLAPLGFHIGNKAYIAVEKRYVQWVDGLAGRFLAGKDLAGAAARLAGKPLGVLVAAVQRARVPECLRAAIVSAALRALINTYVQAQAGVELDFVVMAQALLRHRGAVEAFLLGRPGSLKPLMVDLVDGVPDSQLDAVATALNARYSAFKR